MAQAQLAAWLPRRRSVVVDISGPRSASASQAAAAGHHVVRVAWGAAGSAGPPSHADGAGPGGHWAGGRGDAGHLPDRHGGNGHGPDGRGGNRRGHDGHGRDGHGTDGHGAGRGRHPGKRDGKLVTVTAESGSLACLADGSADCVIADDSTLSRHLMAEDVTAEIARVLRPGGSVLACVDSLVLGMAILAEQHHWAHLTDLPHAEVVLIPWPDGTITRCFGASQFRELLTEAGLEACWIRPRTVLSPSTVDHVLRKDPGAISRLVRAEMDAGTEPGGEEPDESFGIHLLAAARKPA